MKGCGTFHDLPRIPKRALPENLARFGGAVRELRKSLDLSMGEVAKFLGCSVVRVSDLERGEETDPRFKFCTAQGCGENTYRSCTTCGGKGYVDK